MIIVIFCIYFLYLQEINKGSKFILFILSFISSITCIGSPINSLKSFTNSPTHSPIIISSSTLQQQPIHFIHNSFYTHQDISIGSLVHLFLWELISTLYYSSKCLQIYEQNSLYRVNHSFLSSVFSLSSGMFSELIPTTRAVSQERESRESGCESRVMWETFVVVCLSVLLQCNELFIYLFIVVDWLTDSLSELSDSLID